MIRWLTAHLGPRLERSCGATGSRLRIGEAICHGSGPMHLMGWSLAADSLVSESVVRETAWEFGIVGIGSEGLGFVAVLEGDLLG